MEKKYITKTNFKKLKYLNPPIHTESILFYDDNNIYKLLNKDCLDREKTILKLDRLTNDNIVTPNGLLHDRRRFLGYYMKYYKDYYPLNIVDKTFKEKKEYCYRIYNILKFLNDNQFAYYDIHSNNILIKDDDLKLIDMDSGIFLDDDIEKYDTYLRKENYALSCYLLSLLYDINKYDLILKLLNNKNTLSKIVPDYLINFYNYVIDETGTFIDTMNYIDLIDENHIKETKHILKMNS
jgi:hypothetical protein